MHTYAQLGKNQQGMSLLELVIVIVLIGGLLAVLGSRIIGSKARAEYKLAQAQVEGLSQKIELYYVDVGEYPKQLDDLVQAPAEANTWLGPYAKATEFKDPWAMPIEYRVPDDMSNYTLTSLAADRKAGGTGVDKDIVVSP